MLSRVMKIGRHGILSQFWLIFISRKFNYACQIFSSNNKYINKIENRFSHITTVQYNSKENPTKSSRQELNDVQYDKIVNDTFESLTEYFDEIIENTEHLYEADVTYENGVITINFGDEYGTYVINRQTPNKQIWLSSPKSGPKRYDFIDGTWIYKHDGKSLHELLDNEIPLIIKGTSSFNKCVYGRRTA